MTDSHVLLNGIFLTRLEVEEEVATLKKQFDLVQFRLDRGILPNARGYQLDMRDKLAIQIKKLEKELT